MMSLLSLVSACNSLQWPFVISLRSLAPQRFAVKCLFLFTITPSSDKTHIINLTFENIL